MELILLNRFVALFALGLCILSRLVADAFSFSWIAVLQNWCDENSSGVVVFAPRTSLATESIVVTKDQALSKRAEVCESVKPVTI